MKNYYYFLNCRYQHGNNSSPAFCRFRDFRSANFLRNGDWHTVGIQEAGWHFGYLMSPEQIAKKLEMFSHSEFDTNYYKDTNRIQKCMDSNTDLFDRNGFDYSIETLDVPKYIMNNINKYQKFIINKETL
jgi:beta-1,4-mannosyl-glycoprotein beta-1,4-N-acetylglucosaminyltransferase